MWEPRRVRPLRPSTACYRDSFTFLLENRREGGSPYLPDLGNTCQRSASRSDYFIARERAIRILGRNQAMVKSCVVKKTFSDISGNWIPVVHFTTISLLTELSYSTTRYIPEFRTLHNSPLREPKMLHVFKILLLPWRWKQKVPPKLWFPHHKLHNATTKKPQSWHPPPWEPQLSHTVKRLEHCTPLLILYRQRAIMLYSSSSGRVQEAVFSGRGRGYLPQ
jgi:hypothetical protein